MVNFARLRLEWLRTWRYNERHNPRAKLSTLLLLGDGSLTVSRRGGFLQIAEEVAPSVDTQIQPLIDTAKPAIN